MNLKILALISIIFLASISVAFAAENITNSNNSFDKYVYGEDYIIVNDTIHWLSHNKSVDADDLKLKESLFPNKTENTSVKENNSINNTVWQKEQAEFYWYLKHGEELGIEEYLKTHPYFDGNTVDLPEDPFPNKDYDHRLIVLSMDNRNRSSFANLDHYLEYDGNCFIMFYDPTAGSSLMNNTQVTSNNDNSQVLDDVKANNQYSQVEWYTKNIDKLDLVKYLENNAYFDGASVDLPDDPFPDKDSNSRLISFMKNDINNWDSLNKDNIYFLELDKYLDGEIFKKLGVEYVNGTPNITLLPWVHSLVKYAGNASNSTANTENHLNDSSILEKLNDAIDTNASDSNSTPTANAKSVTTESTGIPIAILALAILVSVIGFRRKL